jgi:hypothetical protein
MKKVLVFLVAVMVSCNAFAWGWGRHGYYYSGGNWWLGNAIVAGLVAGAVVASLPPRCETVYVGGYPYYYDGSYYYQRSPNGYVVVEPVEGEPVAVQPVATSENVPPQNYSAENKRSVSILIANSNGTSTTIMLIKKGSGYVGPEGEYYEAMPTMKQIKAVYGQ